MWYGSTMDTVRRFLAPDQRRCIQGSLAAMSIDAFDGGPWTPGSNASTLYHYLIGGGNVEYIMPRGGIGSLSTALCRRAESLGAEVQMKTEGLSLTRYVHKAFRRLQNSKLSKRFSQITHVRTFII